MASPSRFPFRVEYLNAVGERKVTEPFYEPKMATVLIVALRAAGASEFSVYRDGAMRPTPGCSVSKYPGNPHRKWNGGL